MLRFDRAIAIRDQILGHPASDWKQDADRLGMRTLRRPGFTAMHWAHDRERERPSADQLSYVATNPKSPYLNILDLYVSEHPNKALSLSWRATILLAAAACFVVGGKVTFSISLICFEGLLEANISHLRTRSSCSRNCGADQRSLLGPTTSRTIRWIERSDGR
jgi:hypothetical protein